MIGYRIAARVLALSAVVALAGCGTVRSLTGGGDDSASSSGGSSGSGFWRSTFMFGSQAPVVKQEQDTRSMTCPAVTVLDGTSAYRVGGAGGNDDVSYQASVIDLARECRLEGNSLYMRVGVAGRLLLGPKGHAGTYQIPVRIAVKDGDKVPYSNVVRVSVTIPPGQSQVDFTDVRDNIVLPVGATDPGAQYDVFAGFDASGAAPAHHRKVVRRRHR